MPPIHPDMDQCKGSFILVGVGDSLYLCKKVPFFFLGFWGLDMGVSALQ